MSESLQNWKYDFVENCQLLRKRWHFLRRLLWNYGRCVFIVGNDKKDVDGVRIVGFIIVNVLELVDVM